MLLWPTSSRELVNIILVSSERCSSFLTMTIVTAAPPWFRPSCATEARHLPAQALDPVPVLLRHSLEVLLPQVQAWTSRLGSWLRFGLLHHRRLHILPLQVRLMARPVSPNVGVTRHHPESIMASLGLTRRSGPARGTSPESPSPPSPSPEHPTSPGSPIGEASRGAVTHHLPARRVARRPGTTRLRRQAHPTVPIHPGQVPVLERAGAQALATIPGSEATTPSINFLFNFFPVFISLFQGHAQIKINLVGLFKLFLASSCLVGLLHC